MSATASLTSRLVEHRYGRALHDLRRQVAHHRTADPVLPIVLRRLAALEETGQRTLTARRTLHTALRGVIDTGVLNDRVPHHLAEVWELEQRELSEAEAVWDLLDVRLLLDDRPGTRPAPSGPPGIEVPVDVLDAAREVAAGMPRLTRDGLRAGLRARGIRISSHRVGQLLHYLRAERTR
jgi:hypothetical protein